MPKLQTIDRAESLAHQAYGSLRRAIRDKTLDQETVYSENELAASMGISRTPVREALIELTREGLVEILPQRGFRVRRLAAAEQSEIFAVRLALEELVVSRLAKEATADDLLQLRSLIKQQRAALADPTAFLERDEQMHLLMPQLLGLRRTHQILMGFRGAMWLIGSLALTVKERAPGVLEEHIAIVDAIEARDVRAAVRQMRSHIESTSQAAAADVRVEGDGAEPVSASRATGPSST